MLHFFKQNTLHSIQTLVYILFCNLAKTHLMKGLFISLSVLPILLNFISFLKHVTTTMSHKTFSFAVIAINLNDILCGIYLGCIWIADLMLKSKFQVKEHLWRSSIVSFSAFWIMMWLTILTQFVLIFLSSSRLMIVIHPIDTKFKRTNFVCKVIAWLMSFPLLCPH